MVKRITGRGRIAHEMRLLDRLAERSGRGPADADPHGNRAARRAAKRAGLVAKPADDQEDQ